MRRDAGALQAASSLCMVVVCSSSTRTHVVVYGCVSYAASEHIPAGSCRRKSIYRASVRHTRPCINITSTQKKLIKTYYYLAACLGSIAELQTYERMKMIRHAVMPKQNCIGSWEQFISHSCRTHSVRCRSEATASSRSLGEDFGMHQPTIINAWTCCQPATVRISLLWIMSNTAHSIDPSV
jgi:hypothetical protein